MNVQQILANHNLNCGIGGSKTNNIRGELDSKISEKITYEATYKVTGSSNLNRSIYNISDTEFLFLDSSSRKIYKLDISTNTATLVSNSVLSDQRYPMVKYEINDSTYYIYGKYILDQDFNLYVTMNYPVFVCPENNKLYYGYHNGYDSLDSGYKNSAWYIYSYDIETKKSTKVRTVNLYDLGYSTFSGADINMVFYHNWVFLNFRNSIVSASESNSRYTSVLLGYNISTDTVVTLKTGLMYLCPTDPSLSLREHSSGAFYNKYNDKYYYIITADPHWNNDDFNYYILEISQDGDSLTCNTLLFESVDEEHDTFTAPLLCPSPDSHIVVCKQVKDEYCKFTYITLSKKGINIKSEILFKGTSPNGLSTSYNNLYALLPNCIICGGGSYINKYNFG